MDRICFSEEQLKAGWHLGDQVLTKSEEITVETQFMFSVISFFSLTFASFSISGQRLPVRSSWHKVWMPPTVYIP